MVGHGSTGSCSPLRFATAWLGACIGACSPQAVSDDGGTAEASSSSGTDPDATGPGATGPGATGPATTDPDDSTGPVVACGNGQLEPGEQCDGMELGGATCMDLFGYGGELSCTDACTLEAVGCFPPGMILVPGGEFWMGSDAHSDDERPARQVSVDAFYIDANEVTTVQYAECVQAGACGLPGSGGDCNWGVPGREDHPMNCVSWTDASAYCAWAGAIVHKRLPTEAEWEKAARSADERLYPWGDEPPPSCRNVVMDIGTGGGCGMLSTLPVGSRPLGDSPYGVHDMAGGVWDWVSDWYAVYDVSETDNPTGPPTGTLKVMRGGGWGTTDPNWFRTSARIGQRETNVNRNVGFRCAQSVPTAP